MVGQMAATSLQAILFGQSEPGFMFDPTDLTTLYQDRAGTTPVTAAGQSVGLRLDKSQGLRQGPELVIGDDSTFTGGVGAWASSASFASTASSVGGELRVSITAAFGRQVLAIPSVSGKTYKITGIARYVSGATSATPMLGLSTVSNGASANYKAIPQSTSYAECSAILIATGSTIYATLGSNDSGAIGAVFAFDNISVRELAGNHEVAVSDAKRGVYGWMPKTGKRNLLTYTEQFDNAVWSARWGGIATVSPNDPTFLAPDGTQTVDKVTATLGGAGAGQAIALTSGVTYTFSCWVNSPAAASDLRIATAATGGGVVALASIPSSASLVRYSLTYTPSVTQTYYVGVGNSLALQTVYIWGAQLEAGSTATAYQRVVSQYDITESGVPTCYYVQADGVDDAYVTPTITPNTDKVQVFAGVRKLSDATTGIFAETSLQSYSSNGSFVVGAPDTGATYSFGSTGSLFRLVVSPATFASPTTNVVTGLGDISGDVARLRVNGAQVAQSTADQGTGNYLAYPAYIYARGGTSLPFNGLDFGHAVRFGPNLDAATIARVEALIARNTPEVTL